MSRGDRPPIDETQLLERAREFDEDALTWIYQNYHDAIYRYLYRHLGEAQTAQDLASDVFRRFLQALRKGSGPTRQLSAWLYRVAHNLMVDQLRRREYRDHASLDETPDNAFEADAVKPDVVAGNTLALERVRDALHTLTDAQRQVITLKFLEGLSNAEVAEITGKTVGAVKALQHRGLEALRDELTAQRAFASLGLSGEQVPAPSFGS